jgi:hypothetical protein
VGHIWLFVTLVLSAAASLRGASRTLETVLSLFAPALPCPSWYAGRLWLLRIGYYKLTRPKPKASDWVWILDHTVQVGVEKCLLILGVRLSELSRTDLVLGHEDVEPIALLPVRSSNGEVVFQQLEQTIDQTGLPREILADQGSDLKAGIERFCHQHPQTCSIHDIKPIAFGTNVAADVFGTGQILIIYYRKRSCAILQRSSAAYFIAWWSR